LPPDLYSLFTQRLGRLLDAVAAPEKPVLAVACSGGPDSMALLHLTQRYCATHGGRCCAIHVHHGVRETAAQDAEIVRQFTERLQIAMVVVPVRLHQIQQRETRGQEADLRRLRYEALFGAAEAFGADALLVAHHGDDQLETVLWRLARGTSLTGLGGIREVVSRGPLPILRPLLQCSKADLAEYSALEKIPFATDETNDALHHPRNLLRHQVVPHLKAMNPEVLAAVDRMCQALQEEDQWLEQQAQAAVDRVATVADGSVGIVISQLQSLAVPLQRRVIKILLYCLASTEWTFQHIADILQLAASNSPSAYIELPQGLVARRLYGIIRIEPREQSGEQRGSQERDTGDSITWHLDKVRQQTFKDDNHYPWRFFCDGWVPSESVVISNRFSALFPKVESLEIRVVRPGDKIALLGMTGHRKLQDLFVDAKVPKGLRRVWPVVCSGDEVVWVPGLARSRKLLLAGTDMEGWRVTCAPEFSFHEAGFFRPWNMLETPGAYL